MKEGIDVDRFPCQQNAILMKTALKLGVLLLRSGQGIEAVSSGIVMHSTKQQESKYFIDNKLSERIHIRMDFNKVGEDYNNLQIPANQLSQTCLIPKFSFNPSGA